MLIKAGWPQSALLLTVVLDEKGEGHAILTARTVAGDYVLDNKNDDLKVWHKTPYRFIMRQSYLNPRLWMSLDPKEAAPSVPMAGMRQSQQVAKSR
jgi:predicted transglutaminase-like cysteine proteinase